MNGTIVLAHGLFGFGDLVPGFQALNYFNGVADLITQTGKFKVFAPQVDPVGSIQFRGDTLAKAILSEPGLVDPLHIIAHSMGGLDARHVITHRPDVSPRIATLVTIGTPHAGSQVADVIVDDTNPLIAPLVQKLPKRLTSEIDALNNLTTAFCTQFNKTTADQLDKVRYFNIAGDASHADSELAVLKLAATIGGIKEINDGVVTRKSALRDCNIHLDDWPVDHLGEIGWSLTTVSLDSARRKQALQAHLDRYQAILDLL